MSKPKLGASSRNQQKAIDAFMKVNFLFMGGSMFGGKVQPYSSIVYTKFGKKLLSDISVGDKILNPNGTEQKVIAVHPHKDHQFYKVTFDDDSYTYCGMEHLWLAWCSQKNTKKSSKLKRLYGQPSQESLYPAEAEVISLEGIKSWIDRGHTVNIPITKPLCFTGTANDSLDPYVIGTSLKACSSTTYFPQHYLVAPINVRESLLQGLMDSDGYVDDRGHLEYTTTSKKLSDGFVELVRGLGGKISVKVCQGVYKDKSGNKVECKEYYRHYLRVCDSVTPFRLKRKLARVKQTKRLSRKVVSIEPAMVCDGACITVSDPNRLYITDDYIVTHNSYLAALLSTIYARDPTSRIAVFRRTLEQMKKGGAIVDTFKQVYKQLGDECKLEVSVNPLVGKIVSGTGAGSKRGDGCKIDFIQMSGDKDMESIRGAAFNLAVIEEAIPDFTQEQIEFILARLRNNSNEQSLHGLNSKLLVTGNPDPDSFMCTLIKDYYLDADGYPIQDRMGDIRYFLKVRGEYVWGESKEEVYDRAEALGNWADERIETTKEERLQTILSFSFVQLTIQDNPIGRKNNPSYMAQLLAMDEVKKARNLYGKMLAA
jgi:hypothetical protein